MSQAMLADQNVGGVIYERQGAIAVLTLNEPQRRNAMSAAIREQLADGIRTGMTDSAVRALVITGSGGSFCAGGDISAMDRSNSTVLSSRRRMAQLRELGGAIINGEKPVVAAVEGFAYGAGLGLAAACDYVVCARDAKFCAAFAKIGLMADNGCYWTLPQRVGFGRAKAMIMLAQVIDGETAVRIGLAEELAETGEALASAMNIARQLAEGPPAAHALTKATFAQMPLTLDDVFRMEADGQTLLFSTEDFAEGGRSFFEKRKPNFTGR
jgi:enoyl-CoA hydratase/carnithine racemase